MENDPIKFIKQTFNVNDDDCRVQKAEALCKAITRLNGRLGIADLHNVAQQGDWDAQDLMIIASLLAKGGFFAEYFYLPALSGKTKWIPEEIDILITEKGLDVLSKLNFYFEASWRSSCKGPISPSM